MNYTQTGKDLKIHFDDQIRFIKRSVQYYDEGDYSEAKRIAVSLRVLFHQTQKSKSLLSLLDYENKLLLLSSGGLYTPSNLVSSWTLLSISFGATGSLFRPLLSDVSWRTFYLDFDDWWNEVIFDDKEFFLSRRDIVLLVANQDGGAHVDPKLKQEYSTLTKKNSLGVVFVKNDTEFPVHNNPAYAAIRQVAHEVLTSLAFFNKEFIRKPYVERLFEMRYIDDVRRFKWSSTDIESSEETFSIVNAFRLDDRIYYIDNFEKGKREVITSGQNAE